MEEVKRFRSDMCLGLGPSSMMYAIGWGQFESVKWLYENGCPFEDYLISMASWAGLILVN